MKLKEIVAIAGQPGLFKYVAQSSKGIIVESLIDNKRTNVSGNQRVSSLAEIALFTNSEDLPLEKVFERFAEKAEKKQIISHKSTPQEMKALFEEYIPEYDRDNVRTSDMKKIIMWYNMLADYDFFNKVSEETEDPADTTLAAE